MKENDNNINTEAIIQEEKLALELFTRRIHQYPKTALLVDYEGVILPYNFERTLEDFSSHEHLNATISTNDEYRHEIEKHIEKAVDRFPINNSLIVMLKQMAAIDAKRVILTGASELEGWNETHHNHFRMPMINEKAIQRSRNILQNISQDTKYLSENLGLPDRSLVIFINDIIGNDNLPPSNLIRKVHTYQPNASTFHMSTVHIPRFTNQINGNYKRLLCQSVIEGLSPEPIALPAHQKHTGSSSHHSLLFGGFRRHQRRSREGD